MSTVPSAQAVLEIDQSLFIISVEQLELTVQSYNCLKKGEINIVDRLLRKTEVEMLQISNFTRACLKDVNNALSALHPDFKIGMLAGK